MFTTKVTTRSLMDIDGTLLTIFNKKSLKWKTTKKFNKLNDKMTTLSFIGESFWNTIKEVKPTIKDSIDKSIYYSAISVLQHLKLFNEPDNAIDNIDSAAAIIETKMTNTKICDNFYAAFLLDCVKFNMTTPIILYDRLFEEERFQYVSFIFGKRVFIIEITTDCCDVQQRACETMCALIRKSGGLPKVSSFIKVLGNIAHMVAEIDLQNETFTMCELVPVDLEILNLNEFTDLITASHYLSDQPRDRIEDICAQTLFYKQHFLDGLHVHKKSVFGCIDQTDTSPSTLSLSQQPITLVHCDTVTQSNFLWNDKPFTVNVKYLMANNLNCVASKMPYQRLDLLPMNVVSESDESGGIRYGDQILYDGPLVIVLD